MGSFIGWLTISIVIFLGMTYAHVHIHNWSIFLIIGFAWAIIAAIYIGIYWWGTGKISQLKKGS